MPKRERYPFRARDHGDGLEVAAQPLGVLRAHQTRNARIVPLKISNASPHKEKFIAQSAASLSIRPSCALCSVIDTNIDSCRKYIGQ
jgi:hypothetical protein